MTTLQKRYLLSAIIAGAIGLTVAGCAPLELPNAAATDVATPMQETTVSGYPEPGDATPTVAAPTPTRESMLATPRPDETVDVGEIMEVPELSLEPQLPYSLEVDAVGNPATVYVHNVTGERVRLGDDCGDALFQTKSEKYIVWSYHRGYCNEQQYVFKPGLYAREVVSGKDIYIAYSYYARRIEGDWLLYQNFITYTTPAQIGPAPYLIEVTAYNLLTGERIELTKSIEVMLGRNSVGYYTIHENMIAWMDKDTDTNQVKIRVLDLASRTTKTLNVETNEPHDIAVSRTLVIWQDRFWKGYDLTQDALFTPPWIPPGMENAQGSFHLTAQDDTIQWTFIGDDGTLRYFTAPIARKT